MDPQLDWQRLLGERAWLASLARQLVRHDEVADEAAHEALAAAWMRAAPQSVGPRRWLAAILGKQLAGRRRAQHRRAAREQQVAAPDPAPPAADVVSRFEVQRAVADAVLALPEPYRTTVLRRFWDDEQPAAIAAAMQVPVETVRTRLKRGLSMLRERLDAAHGDRRAWALPLWVATRRAESLATGLLLGVSLMTAMHKLVAACIAAGLAVLLWTTLPEPAPVLRSTASAGGGAVPVVAGDAPAATAPPSDRTEAPATAVAAAAAGEQHLVVTGRVVDDATGEGLPGIPVRLVTWPRDEASEPCATSEADGLFTLHGSLAAREDGEVEVFVESPDHAFAHAGVAIARTAAGAPELARGDAGTLRLEGGTWLSGVVVDADGIAVGGAQLLLPLDYQSFGGGHPQQMLHRFAVLGRSDAAGRFRLAHAIGSELDHGNLLFAVATSGIGWHRFTPSKQRVDVTDVVVRQRPAGALRVVVQGPAGTPRAGVLVRALPGFSPLGFEGHTVREEASEFDPVRSFFRASTDGNGVARFPVLPVRESDLVRVIGDGGDGAYDVWVAADGFPEQALVRCEVRPGAEVEVAVRLAAARRVTVAVAVRDDTGAPIPGIDVEVGGEGTSSGGRTDAAGRADVGIEAAPKLVVSATSGVHRDAYQAFDVGPDVSSVAVDVVLTRAVPLEGVLVDQLGEPVPGMSMSADGHSIEATTDERGRFRIAKFPVGEHELTVAIGPGMEPTHWTGKHEPELVDAARGPVRIVMHRRPGRTDVRVAVVDARSGESLEPTNARLGLFDPEHGQFVQVKRVQTGTGLVTSAATPAGQWRLDVVTASGHRGSLSFELDDTRTTAELRLPLPPTSSLTGRVQFAGVAPVETLYVHAQHAVRDPRAFEQFRFAGRWAADPASQSVFGAANGGMGYLVMQPARNPSFRLDRVDPDQDLVFRVVGDGVQGEATVRVAPGGTADVVIQVLPKAKAGPR